MPTDVVIRDAQDTPDSMRVDRVLSAMDASLGLIDAVIQSQRYVGVGTTDTGGQFNFDDLYNSDEMLSYRTQYAEWRVKFMAFDVYDLQPNSIGTAFWSTGHIKNGATLGTSLGDVVDRPDAKVVPPGEGKIRLTWVAHGVPENGFQNAGTAAGYTNFGGMTYSVPGQAVAVGSKFTYIVKAHVQFRGRY